MAKHLPIPHKCVKHGVPFDLPVHGAFYPCPVCRSEVQSKQREFDLQEVRDVMHKLKPLGKFRVVYPEGKKDEFLSHIRESMPTMERNNPGTRFGGIPIYSNPNMPKNRWVMINHENQIIATGEFGEKDG